MNKQLDVWAEMKGANIISDRDALPGEVICAYAIDNDNGRVLSRVDYAPTTAEQSQYTWPKFFSDTLNQTSAIIRAGEKEGERFKTHYSGYLNALWYASFLNVRVFTTACHLKNWLNSGLIESSGNLLPGASITLQVMDPSSAKVIETLTFNPTPVESSRYNWPYFLSRYINANSPLLRAGEKNQETRQITPQYSGYRNVLWLPALSGLTVTLQHILPEHIKHSAETVHAQLIAKHSAIPPEHADIEQWVLACQNGRFNDIDYPPEGKQDIDPAPLYLHIDRVKAMADYIARYQDATPERFSLCAVDALNFYGQQDYDPINWWDRHIGLGKKASIAALLLSTLMRNDSLKVFFDYIKKTTHADAPETGANLADYCYIQLIWSLADWKTQGSTFALQSTYAAYQMLSTLCFPVERHGKENGEGISLDNSYSQHNPGDGQYSQLYASAYGTELLGRIFESLSVSSGIFSLSSPALRSLEQFIIEGMGWMGYAYTFDMHTRGRSISEGLKNISSLASWAKQLLKSGPLYPDALAELIKRANGDEAQNSFYIGNRAFWVNDYMTHFTSEFGLFAKCISNRTVGCESGNGGNLKGYYVGNGSCFIYRHGNEYRDIQPVWDWQKLPGTTVEQNPDFKFPLINWGVGAWGSHAYAGGASDGRCGINSMTLTKGNISHAQKSIIALPERAVFIGSNIDTAAASAPVTTQVNQCLLNGTVTVKLRDGTSHTATLPYTLSSSSIAQIEHDGLYYRFFDIEPVTLQITEQTGRWRDINTFGSTDLIKAPVFSVWITHPCTQEARYHYEIGPLSSLSDAHYVIINRYGHAAVTQTPPRAIGAVFNGEVPLTVSLTSTLSVTPLDTVSFICEKKGAHLVITCADPTQALAEARFIVASSASKEGSSPLLATITITLPTGDDAGKSVTHLQSLA
ncbi:polysaccharide lyase family 8 super-sandwich domain-containing protein [Pseudomonas sp.]|uniref:polysaccharide lyase family 8 super-sandwich domain-containing protein n=1 Tax=Pseudomonas sp. TaxID=306 RepID=UPI00261DAD08|nr:polysaccharide lyase family 8 super-sandwich domain-containing protein [Pseudomonas sp.]